MRAAVRAHLPAIAVFGVAVSATLLVSWQLGQTAHGKDLERFESAAVRLEDAVLARIEMYVAMLRAGAALFDVSPGEVTRAQFHDFVARLELRERYPGIQGVGFTRRVLAADRAAYEASRRAAGQDGFAIWQGGADAPRAEYHTIVYLEPLDERNRAAIGYDMFTEPTRQEAMARARDTGGPAASGPVTLVQEIDDQIQRGFLIYMPVYAGGGVPPTVEERRDRLLGFVYSPFRTGDLFAGIFGTAERPRAGFELFDHADSQAPMLYRSSEPVNPWFAETRVVDIAGRPWTLFVFSLAALEAGSSVPLVPLVQWSGVVVSLLLAGLVGLQTQARQRVEHQAEELQALNVQVRQLLEGERIARSEAERNNRLKDEFLASLSHELRTPLNAIQGWAHMLELPAMPPDKHAHAIDAILRSAQAQRRLIEDLLDMSRIVGGGVRLDAHDIRLADVIDASVNAVRPAADARNLVIDVQLDGSPAMVTGDAARLQQVFWNLLANAVKFTPPGGRVSVVERVQPGQVSVAVCDTGEGIAPAFLPCVFERFRQADGSITRRHGGLGLGLSIARSLVQMHGGTIVAESPGPGHGATFTITLPLAPASAAAPERPGEQGPAQAPELSTVPLTAGMLAGLSVLAVDDDEDARVLVRDILSAYGAEVVVAPDAEMAIARFRERKGAFDLLVSDIGMPGMDGCALLRTLRAETAGGRPLAAVAVTAYASADDRARVQAAGYRIHLPKPASPHEIVAACAVAGKRVAL